jgi:hypothetical protein
MIRVSSGSPIKTDQHGNRIFGNSTAHTRLLLLLFCGHESEVQPGEMSSPWRDRPEVRSGAMTKNEYLEGICRGIDLVPPDLLDLVIDDLLNSGRTAKPSLRELQAACRAAMQVTEDLERL